MLTGFWFGVIAVLWAGFFVLEGFDFGVGILLPFLGKREQDREQALRSIGPVWDGNEVWLLTAGGATFAAFPEWYASMFSGLYLALALVLTGLILRGIGIEYRGKAATAQGRRWCDAAVVGGSFVPALLFGVAFANLIRGVEMNKAHVVTGSFFDLLSPYALLGGLTTLSLFLLHGALFVALRVEGPVGATANRLARPIAVAAVVCGAAFLIWTTQVRGGWVSFVVAGVIVVALLAAVRMMLAGRPGLAFAASAVTTALVPVWAFACLWPDVMPARNNSAFSLTVHQASSSTYTLEVMTVVALLFTPIVLAYQAWTYWVFRARIGVPVHPQPGSAHVADKVRRAAEQLVPPPAAPKHAAPSQPVEAPSQSVGPQSGE
ncbi:MAG TPA: cytochrome d ubiquinol oxidase subunit II [Jatrophihabitans sp.]|jgi:cytochrome d ubiquinol oxidase subunit II|uniref:cytochrome d ubiquinol oxidase subunit II n=1 Tax=Jatrophihabitans sp. TaxID=1932789 RepID=UPI002E0B478A|nr:cytochrome d ubiquinol oxidase subunit II [Jatrophihabitans sp.]